jgi:hypothetical protein
MDARASFELGGLPLLAQTTSRVGALKIAE